MSLHRPHPPSVVLSLAFVMLACTTAPPKRSVDTGIPNTDAEASVLDSGVTDADAVAPGPARFCLSAGFDTRSGLLRWVSNGTVHTLFPDGRRRDVEPIPDAENAMGRRLGRLEVREGEAGWMLAARRFEPADSAASPDQTPRWALALLRPNGDAVWRGETAQPLVVLGAAGPNGGLIDAYPHVLSISTSGRLSTLEVEASSMGPLSPSGTFPASWSVQTPDGFVTRYGFVTSDGTRTPLRHLPIGEPLVVASRTQYLFQRGAEVVWAVEDEAGLQELTAVTSAHPERARIESAGQHWLLWVDDIPRAVATQDELAVRALTPPEGLLPATTASSNAQWLVGSSSAGPLFRLDLVGGVFEDLSGTEFGERRPFDASYCTPPASADPAGRLVMGLRDDQHGGAFVRDQDGAWKPLGRPVRDVIYVSTHTVGNALLIEAVSGEATYCPQDLETWPQPASDSRSIRGNSLQLIYEAGEPLLLDRRPSLHAEGRCAVVWGRDGEASLLDVPSGQAEPLPELGPGDPTWLQ